MQSELITVNSLTQAYRVKSILNMHHLSANVLPVSQTFKETGCGYSVLVTGDLSQAHQLLQEAGITLLDS